MKAPEPAGSSLWRVPLLGCALVLLCAGVMLLGYTLALVVRPVGPAGGGAGPTLAAVPAGSEERAAEGKRQPTPTPTAGTSAGPPASVDQRPVLPESAADLEALFDTTLAVHDYFDAAVSLGRVPLGDRVVSRPQPSLGDRLTFNTAGGPREAELVYIGDVAEYWVETGLSLDSGELAATAERVDRTYYPLLRQMFGQEWRPGVDGDPRFTVLHFLGPADEFELGYFTDEDQYPRALFPDSNEREMVYLNMTALEPGTDLYEGTLVHELQHLIQWNLDANEDTWMNEGLSQVAETLVGLPTVETGAYAEQPDVRLDRWTAEEPDVFAHYASGYLYLLYLWEQAGDDALRELARQPANGLAAVRAVLAGHRPDLSLEDFTADWAVAAYLDGNRSAPSPYRLDGADVDRPFYADRARRLPFERTAALDQYAVDTIDLDFSGPATLTFTGDSVAPVVDAPPPGGGRFWFAPPADNSRADLTAAVDLTGLNTASLTFDAWYDLEPDYDFAYLSVSTDNGRTWELLSPVHRVTGAYGPALGGASADTARNRDGWVSESVTLDRYAGQPVLVRITVLTDFEATGRGLGVANLQVAEAGMTDPMAWRPVGFVQTGWLLPQQWEVRVVADGPDPVVTPVELDGLNRGEVTVTLGPDGGVVIVVPLTPYVDDAADYWLSVRP